MKEPKVAELFAKIRAFLTEYLPGVRNCSRHTVRSYRAALDQFVTYLAKVRKAPLITVTFDDFSTENVAAFLASLESDRGTSVVTRNHRLACLRAFVGSKSTMASLFIRISSLKRNFITNTLKTSQKSLKGSNSPPKVRSFSQASL